MSSLIRAVVASVGLGALAILAAPEVPAQDAGPKWERDYAAARELSRKTGKPMFLVLR